MNSIFLDRYRRSEYTGSNRCLPCTLVNTIIAVVIANTAFICLLRLNYRPAHAVIAAVAMLGIAAIQIWLRGYLVPWTPRLTRRYFPPWVLRAFGKEPFVIDGGRAESDLDVEHHLEAANAVTSADTAPNIELTDSFAEAWRSAIEDIASVDSAVRAVFDVDGQVQVDETDRSVRVSLDSRPFGRWVSRAALLADLGAGRVFADQYDAWSEASTAERGQLLGELRRYIAVCPMCAAETTFDAATVTGCCGDVRVGIVSCGDCGVRLYEVPLEGGPTTEGWS